MRFKLEMIVNKSRAEVWKLFTDSENISKWQPSLVNIETLNGTPGQVGTISKLTYKEREREFSLTQKITQRDEPNRFDELYENDFADNTIQNKFIEQGQEQTLWITETEYKFKTLVMKVMGNILKKNYIKRTERDMQRFKEIVESL